MRLYDGRKRLTTSIAASGRIGSTAAEEEEETPAAEAAEEEAEDEESAVYEEEAELFECGSAYSVCGARVTSTSDVVPSSDDARRRMEW